MQQSFPVRLSSPFPALRVGMLGIGVVGSGTHRLIERNRWIIRGHAGRDIELRLLAARNVPHARRIVGPDIEIVADPALLVRHPDVDVVVEVIGGCTIARSLVLDAIAHGKHVVSANKALLALHGEEIFAAARDKGVIVAFEGAIVVSIPIVKALREGLAANRIEWLAGILNGTSNFILTRMGEQGCPLEGALEEAQRLGYAEADPSFDVDGIDAGHKLALLASIAFGSTIQFDAIRIEGLSPLALADLRGAALLGYSVKQLALARRVDDRVELCVRPALLPADSLLAQVKGAMNGIMVKSDAAGVTMFYGAGAGSEETASAVVADLIDIARLDGAELRHAVPALGYRFEARSPLRVLPSAESARPLYLRLSGGDRSPAAVASALSRQGIAIRQHLEHGGDLVLLTGSAREDAMECALREILASGAALRLESL